jgi:glycolate oxidase
MIPDEAYRELEEALGAENVSRDPAVLDAYAFQSFQNHSQDFPWIPRPSAVVLPASTAEVQAVVRTCNRHGLKFKALSTGWGAWAGPGEEGVVQIDLRRMDRILEIDEKNMYVVVQPYAICAQVQAEVIKRGLNLHIIGAGSNTSPLASATSFDGYGATGLATGYSGRNLLALEWVLPDGEILRLGTLGSGQGWFCGDGPGPSLRGLVRGWRGAAGGLGVFTACALKLHPWPGPQPGEIRGLTMGLQVEAPPNLKFFQCVFPSAESYADAGYRIAEAEIGYMLCKHSQGSMLAVLTPRLLRRLAGRTSLKAALNASAHQFQVILFAESEASLRYEEKVLRGIVEEAQGVLFDFSLLPPVHRMVWWNLLRNGLTPTAFRPVGGFTTTFGACEAWDHAVAQSAAGEELKRPFVAQGLFLDDLSFTAWGGLYERTGHLSHQEVIVMFDPRNPRSLRAAEEFVNLCTEAQIEKHLGIGIPTFGKRMHERMGPSCSDYHLWQGRVKRLLDEKGLSDSTWYI